MATDPLDERTPRDTETFEIPDGGVPRDPLEGTTLDRRFRLDRLIDRGGFGGVYEGVDLKFDSAIAVKVLYPEKATDHRAFRKEAKLARRFKHPNVVEVYDYGIDHGLSYIVMEFLRGPRLDQIFQQSGRQLPNLVFLKFVREITSALQNAHEQQLIHRDLKPANIKLVDQGRPTERFVLLDLGIASQTSDNSGTLANESRDYSFSPAYASPEQYAGNPVTWLSDIYSLGTILYELLAGRLPFLERRLMALMQAVTTFVPPTFAEAAPDREILPGVEAIVRRCLEKDPAKRPQSMAEVRDALLEAFGHPQEDLLRTTEEGVLVITGDGVSPSASTTLLIGSAATDETIVNPFSGTGPTAQATAPPTVAAPWTRRRALGVAVAVVAAVSLLFFVAPSLLLPAAPGLTLTGESPELTVPAGESVEYGLWLTPGESDEPVQLRLVDIPAGVSVQLPETVSEKMECLVTAAFDARAGRSRLTIAAVSGDLESTWSVDVVTTPPEVWLPGTDYVPAQGAALRKVGRLNVYDRIDRPIDGLAEPATFLLVNVPPGTGGPAPFYMLRDEVSVGQFSAFAEAHPDQVAMTDAGEARWREFLADLDVPAGGSLDSLPAMNVSAIEATQFARWLSGGSGALPSDEQWKAAAGRFVPPEDRAQGGWVEGPYRGTWSDALPRPDVAVDVSAPRQVGASTDDESPYGCRDMAGNAAELTCSLLNGDVVDIAPGTTYEIQYLGNDYLATRPLLYADFDDSTTWATQPVATRNQLIGFRVAIPLPAGLTVPPAESPSP